MAALPLVLALCAALTASACVRVVEGTPGGSPAPDAHLDVRGDSGSAFDVDVQNALSDVTAFWRQAYPTIADGKPLPALKGELYSIDGLEVARTRTLPSTAQDNACLRREKLFIVDNAAYCQLDDSILWDRSPDHLVPLLASKYGSALTALVFAHEFGHAIQQRIGLPSATPTIEAESQADCASGAFIASALEGRAPHFRLTLTEVDSALKGFLQVRDSTPESPEDISHGNGFDRLSALQAGIARGATYCFGDSYLADRQFTERVASDIDLLTGGNEPLRQVFTTAGGLIPDLNRFWGEAGTTVGHRFADVKIAAVGTPPCATSDATEFAYCPDSNSVYYTATFAHRAYYSLAVLDADPRTGDVRIVENQPADFALGAMVAIAWGMAARHQFFGQSIDDAAGLSAAICYAGAYAADINSPTAQEFTLSAPDLDEASSAVLNLVPLDSAFGPRGTTGLQRVASFVTGYNEGLHSC